MKPSTDFFFFIKKNLFCMLPVLIPSIPLSFQFSSLSHMRRFRQAESSGSNQPIHSDIMEEELVRIMLQALQDLNYHETARNLQEESGFAVEDKNGDELRKAIELGRWDAAERIILPMCSQNKESVKFLLRREYFLELLESRQVMDALYVLRSDLAPISTNKDELHLLSSLVLCGSAKELHEQIQWESSAHSRAELFEKLRQYVDPSVLLPRGRLRTLLRQACHWQRIDCPHYYSKDIEYCLLTDHKCDKIIMPHSTVKILQGHRDEVWYLQFSNNGLYLASVSKDSTCIIWDLEAFRRGITILTNGPPSYCAWSRDDSKLLTCGSNNLVQLWDTRTGLLYTSVNEHLDAVTCCAWFPNGSHFLTASCDRSICVWDISGRLLSRRRTNRTLDMKVHPEGHMLITIAFDKTIKIYDLIDGLSIGNVRWYEMPERHPITSLSVSNDGRYALVNVQIAQQVHLWDIREQKLLKVYTGLKQSVYMIRSSFCGDDNCIVLSGSEDNCVYMWDRKREVQLGVLPGHEKTVNCVCSHPYAPMTFASGSDDSTIRIWSVPTGWESEEEIEEEENAREREQAREQQEHMREPEEEQEQNDQDNEEEQEQEEEQLETQEEEQEQEQRQEEERQDEDQETNLVAGL
ncbi:WD40-repeat-containing domain protein [Syncephalastrum racemosum]|uniref:WD40-repeat-containing domain protein n=1 Tax=Syncephalastrum racemosum TaxID=13706 RepID=A0A1X2HX23_SYNRA|nr:WD40-repeat-containing domain protein [Syncephalastrum racemosum]